MYLIKNKLLETISPVFVLSFRSLQIVCAQTLQHMVSHESLLNKHLGHRPKKFGNHCPNRNPTHLPKHEFLNRYNQFYQRIWYFEYYSVHVYMVWSQKIRKSEISLDTGPTSAL